MKLNRNTKKAQWLIGSFNTSEIDSLAACYGRCSQAKERAFYWCINKCANMGGWRFRIMSYSRQTFACGWLYENTETGVIMLNVETYRNTYTIEY